MEAELERQVLYGDGLLAYREHAQNTLEPQELLSLLRRAWQARPDLWHAWSALILQRLDMSRDERNPDRATAGEEALDLARQATARFPLLPRLWLDRALVCQARGDTEGESDFDQREAGSYAQRAFHFR